MVDFAKINTYHVRVIPYFLERLKNTPDGEGSLLDLDRFADSSAAFDLSPARV